MLQNSSSAAIQPKVVVIRRRPNQGFGFTLRHFIAYPPEDDPSWPQEASDPYQVKAMETIFIKEVQPNGPAHFANLQTGDRVLMVNNTPIAGIAYSTVVSMIKQTPSVLTLHVVPKECDVLQMHYTSIAHTPESNRLTAIPKPIPSPVTVGNGNAAGALIPIAGTTGKSPFPQHTQQLISYPALSQGSRSGSVVSTTSSNLRPLTTGNGSNGGSSSLDYNDVHHNALAMRGGSVDLGFTCAPPTNLAALSRQQQQQHQHQQSAAIYTPPHSAHTNVTSNTVSTDTNDLMIRLRESIKQKEEFLKSPLPHTSGQQHHPQSQHQQQHFFPHTPPSGSPQLSASAGSIHSSAPRAQVRTLVKQPLSMPANTAHSRDLLPASCDMQSFYAKNLPGNYASVDNIIARSSSAGGVGSGTGGSGLQHGEVVKSTQFASISRNYHRTGNGSSGLNAALREKYTKDLDYLETLQETGVTNKVFERKLVSHMSKGFDPFKPLSINTTTATPTATATATTATGIAAPIASSTSIVAPNAIDTSVAPGHIVLIKPKPQGVLYESLQNHPLHQLQVQQLQQSHTVQSSAARVQPQQINNGSHSQSHSINISSTSTTSNTSNNNNNSSSVTSVVDGQKYSRMEIHKASLANAIDHHVPNKYTSKLPEAEEKLTESSGSDVPNKKAVSSDDVIRRFRHMSSFDDNKPMRRISYLRATNHELDYQSDTSISGAGSTPVKQGDIGSVGSVAGAVARVTIDTAKEAIEEDTDPEHTYDVVAGGGSSVTCDSSDEPVVTVSDDRGTVSSVNSRRTSINSEMRNSIHCELLSADFNGKMETKDVATEMEAFETEMEIKSSCINGKRMSEYRSWRQVKIEVKGDMLRIYSNRSSKSDNNVIELDIRNFNVFDESVDKKKYVFRMQSKPCHIATLGNELNIEEGPDKLTSSGSSSSTVLHADQQHLTEIYFKTKSLTEMKRIFGLLQWKNSLIYDDTETQGKQLSEPQKATANVTYFDENIQPQQQLQPEYSPISSTSRGEAEASDSTSPVIKTRKSSSHKNIPDKDLGSPKAKNWKDLLFRRGGGNHSADVSPSNLSSSSKTIGSIGVPLRACPMSKDNEYVPLIVDICTNIIETKGLEVRGIYRVPGNKAAISELADQVNKSDFCWDRIATDVRWEDVNVVSSLLKLFIRSLPDALLPCSFYINFIEADKKTGLQRLRELKELMESLPRHSYETMKHLIRHLNRVSKYCEVNLMEPKNLAIIFGPSIIRTPNDTLEIAVKDMKHQCRIVELLVTQYEYFFEHGDTPNIADVSGNVPVVAINDTTCTISQTQESQTNMLLHNVSKIERLTETTRTSRFIPQLRRRTHSKRGAVSSDTYSGESVLSLDYAKTTHTASSSSTNVTTASSSSSSSTTTTTKKKERSLLTSRAHHRKASLDEKDSGSGSGSGSSLKEQQRSSVDISILLTDDESSNSRISDSGSMSLTTITDTLDTKLRNLRSGSESNDENGSPDFPKNRRHTLGQPLHLHSENIPYADESPERNFHGSCPLDAPNVLLLSKSCTVATVPNTKLTSEQRDLEREQKRMSASLVGVGFKSNKLQHSATAPINSPSSSSGGNPSPSTAASTPTAVVTVKTTTSTHNPTAGAGSARNSYAGKNTRFSSSMNAAGCCSEDDSEGSTTSDPKEALIMASPSFFLDRYKKRRDHRLFRSASFNCRNYSTRHGVSGGGHAVTSGLTKDEKTDMNLTKKRQIQNKQNRSIKRRHTVGGPHDYSSTGANNCNHRCKASANGTTTTTTVLRRIPIPSASGNIANNNNNNNAQQSDGSSSNGNSGSAGPGPGEHVLEVGIRIKNINRGRY